MYGLGIYFTQARAVQNESVGRWIILLLVVTMMYDYRHFTQISQHCVRMIFMRRWWRRRKRTPNWTVLVLYWDHSESQRLRLNGFRNDTYAARNTGLKMTKHTPNNKPILNTADDVGVYNKHLLQANNYTGLVRHMFRIGSINCLCVHMIYLGFCEILRRFTHENNVDFWEVPNHQMLIFNQNYSTLDAFERGKQQFFVSLINLFVMREKTSHNCGNLPPAQPAISSKLGHMLQIKINYWMML